jgi:hypothetical protein
MWLKIKKHYDDVVPEELHVRQIHGIPDSSKHKSEYTVIPEPIREEFERTEQRGIETTVEIDHRKVHIYMLAPASRKDDFYPHIRKVIAWLKFISTLTSQHCANDLHLYFLLTDAKKMLPLDQNEKIGTVHANTAFTTSCSASNYIFVFRREEWFKVFIHETFHCMGLDFSADENATAFSNKCVLSLFPAVDPATDVRLYETYCEMWAELIYIAFREFLHGREFTASRYADALQKEQTFSVHQSNKLLRRAGFTFEELFALPPPDKKLYKEHTQAFSYYVLKSALLLNADEFLRWCSSNNPAIQFDLSRIHSYCLLVERSAKSAKYRNSVKMKREDGNRFTRNTLRMTSPK